MSRNKGERLLPPGKRKDYICKIRMDAEQRLTIAANAKVCGLGVSAFLRSLGTRYSIPPVTANNETVKELLRLRADLNRLGNLQRLWLKDVAKFDETTSMTIHRVIEQIAENLAILAEAGERLLKEARDGR